MNLIYEGYLLYLPSLPPNHSDSSTLRLPSFLSLKVEGVDDSSRLFQVVSGSQGFETFITPLLEFDWNAPWLNLPDIMRWIAPFLRRAKGSVLFPSDRGYINAHSFIEWSCHQIFSLFNK